MGIMKSFVRNRSRPEGSIAEGYITIECLTFCSRYLVDTQTKFNSGAALGVTENDVHTGSGLGVFRCVGTPLGGAQSRDLTNVEWEQAHRYVLNQCEESRSYIEYV